MSNMLACAAYDAHKEDRMSALIIPKRHVGSFFDMILAKRSLCLELVRNIQSNMR